MKNITRIVSALLVLLMLVASFAACANDPAVPADTTVAANTEETKKTEETESIYDVNGYLKDSIPESLKLNSTVKLLHWSDTENPEFFVEESSGNLVNDAIYNRNLKVEERLAVTIEYIGTLGNYNNNAAYLTTVKNAVSGGENYDLYAAYSMTTANVAYNGFARNLKEYEIIDFSKPWWRDNLIKEATINNKLYFAAGDLSTNLLYMMYCVFFNKDLLDEYKLDNPYDLVDSKSWTYEKMFEMASAVGIPADANDDMGFCLSSNVHIDPFFWGAGLRVIDRDGEGALQISDSFGGEKANEVAAITQKFLHEPYSATADSAKHFQNGTAIFTLDRAQIAPKNLADATFQFGIVPMPVYSDDQENYVTCLGYPYTLYAISTSSTQPEAAAAVLECWSSEGYRTITPALFEVSMKFKYTSDSQAGRMFDIIRSTVSFDIGRIFTTNFGNVPYSLFRNNADSATALSYATQYKGQKKSMEKYLKDLNAVFDNLE
ncbi:MAG: hypothetical protein MJ137_09440 [Clostridia bacterium]|nr:hypothetical protein [Clostridia bacterium]